MECSVFEFFLDFEPNTCPALPSVAVAKDMYIDACRNVSTDTIEKDCLAVRDEISLESLDEYFDSGSFMPRVRLLQHGLSDHDVPRHRWRYFPKMQMDGVFSFEQFDLDAALLGHVSFYAASADPIAIPDAPVGQSMECHVLPFVPYSEPNSSPVLVKSPFFEFFVCG